MAKPGASDIDMAGAAKVVNLPSPSASGDAATKGYVDGQVATRAPAGAEYLVGAAHGELSAERVVTDTPTVAWDLATAGQAKANVPDNAVTNAKLRDSAGLSVIGRSSISSGDPDDIVAAENTVLARATGTLGFMQVVTAHLTDAVVTLAKLAAEVLVRMFTSQSKRDAVEALESGGVVAANKVPTAAIQDGAVTAAKEDARLRYRTFVLVVPGDPAVGAGASVGLINKFGSVTIVAVESTCRVAPSSGTYTYDLNKNGTTVYTTQANRPTRTSADGTGRKAHTLPDVTSMTWDDVLTVDVDGVGAGISDFTLHVVVRLD
ncbi:MAG: hypothetical protein QN174_07755 [Armatimonadota bacterium]|nr:hypothetical protein [Armatimonadota bacterium]